MAGGAHRDAVGVCAHELKDPQLALFLARLLEGPQGPLQQALISDELLHGIDCSNSSVVIQASRHLLGAETTFTCHLLTRVPAKAPRKIKPLVTILLPAA